MFFEIVYVRRCLSVWGLRSIKVYEDLLCVMYPVKLFLHTVSRFPQLLKLYSFYIDNTESGSPLMAPTVLQNSYLNLFPDCTAINPIYVLSDKSLTPSFIHSVLIFGNFRVSYWCQQIIIQTHQNKPYILIAISVLLPCFIYISLWTVKETCK